MIMPDDMITPNEPEQPQKPKSKTFYIALLVCTVALGAAGWATYNSVKDYLSYPADPYHSSSERTTTSKPSSKEIGKSGILEGSEKADAEHRTRKPIPYDSPKSSSFDPQSESDTAEEELVAVSAEKADMLIEYPVSNDVIKEFSDGKPVFSKTLGDWRAHDGVDFKADKGSTVKSISGGTVKDICSDAAYGTTVVIEHDAKFTAYYSGLAENPAVQNGQRVKSGQEIGAVAVVPCEKSEEPHLHLRVYKDDKFIDPLLVLEKETQ